MQLISVERGTFRAGLAVAFLAPWVTTVFAVLFLVSVALGGSRGPSVRRIPAQPQTQARLGRSGAQP